MFLVDLKNRFLDGRTRPVRILRGPFRGAIICMSLRDNLRKVFGVYEHELNHWITRALSRVDTVLDVGANDGYFTFGCLAAFQRAGKPGRVIAFEPQTAHCEQLEATIALQAAALQETTVSIEQSFVGREMSENQTTLDAFAFRATPSGEPCRTLIKIDVEGAETDVIEGASQWLNPSNYFLIEVHHESYLEILQTRFSTAGISLERIDQRPYPLLGKEARSKFNWWLVSPLGEAAGLQSSPLPNSP